MKIITTSGPVSRKSQTNTVNNILDVVAKDTGVGRIARMVRINKKANRCVRKSNETLKEIVTRLKKTISLAYLIIVKPDFHSADTQMFSMNLIINARLGEQLFDYKISTLII